MDFDTFLSWEKATRDTLDIKRVYIDMADDLVAGIVLSQIVYWYLPNKQGESKITITKNGKEWIAKARHEWWDEIRVTPKQVDLAIRKLVEKGILEAELFKFKNSPTKHIRIIKDAFIALWKSTTEVKSVNPFLPKGKKRPISTKGENQFLPKGEIKIPQRVKSITETTEKTTEKTTESAALTVVEKPAPKDTTPSLFSSPKKLDDFMLQNMAEPPAYKAYADVWEEHRKVRPIAQRSDKELALKVLEKYTLEQITALTLQKLTVDNKPEYPFTWMVTDLPAFCAKPVDKKILNLPTAEPDANPYPDLEIDYSKLTLRSLSEVNKS